MKSLSTISLSILVASLGFSPCWGAAAAGSAIPDRPKGEEMEVQIKGQFKGRLLVNKVVAPVTFNLEKIQDFPEDPSQKILLDPLPVSQNAEFNARSEVKGHLPFLPWMNLIAEPPFLRLQSPKLSKKKQPASWAFEVLNPQGQTIFRQRGTNELPDEFIWDGTDSEKKFAVVDRLYACQLTMTDSEGKGMVTQGDTVILSALAYGAEGAQTVEISLARLFDANKSTLSSEGNLLIQKFAERTRERANRKVHVRVSYPSAELATQREYALAQALQKVLRLSNTQVTHDSNPRASVRGDIAAFWLK